MAAARPALRDLVMNHAPARAHHVDVLVGGASFFPRILADLEAARSSIHIDMFGFKEGKIGRRVAAILAGKVRDGVEVRLVIDRVGSAVGRGSAPLYEGLVAAGVEVVTNDALSVIDRDGLLGRRRWTRRWSDELGAFSHRKLYVIDGTVAYIGGAGIEDHFADGRFHDVMVRMAGGVVSPLQSTFLSCFRFLGGPLRSGTRALDRYYPPPRAGGGTSATVLHSVPKGKWWPVTRAYHEEIGAARASLDIATAYLVDDRIIARLCGAARRGVRVRILVPGTPNNRVAAAAQRHEYDRLLEAGVSIFEFRGMMHAKVLVRDGSRALVGTANLDAVSLRRNEELNVLIESRRVAAQFLHRLIEPGIRRSARVRPERGMLARARNALVNRVGPWL